MTLAQWMHDAGVTPRQLAQMLGISRQSVYLWLAGKTNPSRKRLAQLRYISGEDLSGQSLSTIGVNDGKDNGRPRQDKNGMVWSARRP